MIPFGPPLIGQTEKALGALLQTVLARRDLTEREWVTLRLASQSDGDLDAFVVERLHDPDAGLLIAALRRRGLLTGSSLSPEGAALVADIGDQIAALTRPLWEDIEPQDAEAAARALNIVLERTRAVLRG
jgi:hypothetical protein